MGDLARLVMQLVQREGKDLKIDAKATGRGGVNAINDSGCISLKRWIADVRP